MIGFLKLIFILAIAGVLVFYFVNQESGLFGGGPKEKIAETPVKESPPKSVGFFDWRNIIPGDYSLKSAPQQPASQQSEIPDSQIPFSFTREQLSPFFKKIKISSVSRSWSGYTPATIQLSASWSSQNETINITGWKLKSSHGDIIIPQAVGIYSPFGWESEKDITLARSNYVYIYSNTSPLNRNLRLNKCTGYLENIYGFNPSLPQDCPPIPRGEYSYLSGQCQSYIMSLGRCELPKTFFYNFLPGTSEGNTCRAFLNTINHSSCFNKHRSDTDFLSNEWRVWVNKDILDPQHDRILLYDKNGLLVDEYNY